MKKILLSHLLKKVLAWFYFISLTFIILLLTSCQNSDFQDHPNFILFITDDISWNDPGCYGNDAIRTPNIDRLAAEGLVFENAYLTASSCSPSRCSIITGRYPHNTGAPELHLPLPEGQVMFPQLLRESGYYTLLSGKNHMGQEVMKAFDTVSPGRGPGCEEDWIDLMMNRPKDKPFFFWFASVDAHRDWQFNDKAPFYEPEDVNVPPMLFDGPETRADLAGYYHEISRTDHYLGEILNELKRQGIENNTYIIYMSDNGRPFPRCKTRLYDSGIKTPFIVWCPGKVPESKTHSLISSVDIAPTILELAGVEKNPEIQGVSFTNILTSPGETVRDIVFAEHNWHVYQNHERMVRYKNWVYIRNAWPERQNLCVESTAHFPAGHELWEAHDKGMTQPHQEDVFLKPRPFEELYNILQDPHQFHNLANESRHREILDSLIVILDSWEDETGDTVPSNPTPDREDLYRNQYPGFERGELPGAGRNAQNINRPGPVRL